MDYSQNRLDCPSYYRQALFHSGQNVGKNMQRFEKKGKDSRGKQ